MNRCQLPPLNDHDEQSFLMTPFQHVAHIEPLRVVAILGMGQPVNSAFLLIQSHESAEDLSAYSISETTPELIWGETTSKDREIKEFICTHWDSLLWHWTGEIDSRTLIVHVGERSLKHHHGFWSWRLWGRKTLEIQHIREDAKGRRNIGVSVGMNTRTDHAGLYFHVYLWNHELTINI